MAYTIPTIKTWTDGERVTRADLDAQIRDGLLLGLNPPACFAYTSANISTPHNAYTTTAIDMDLEYWDNDGMHDITTNPQRITITTTGLWQITAFGNWASSSTGSRGLQVRKNSGDSNSGGTQLFAKRQESADGVVSQLFISWEERLAVDDYIEMFTFQDSGGALNLNAGSSLMARWITI